MLVVLVVNNAAAWLRESLQSLAAQSHERLGIVAVDNGSTDGSRELLVRALGEDRVLAGSAEIGMAGALEVAVGLPAAEHADYLFLLHDDTALAPDAVARMIEAAEGIHGVERVGVVGPKVVDWHDARILREVGRSTDTFGHAYSPLQDGELDQGQYDRVLEVLFVSSCAMLVSREAWQRTGLFDERFDGHYDDLDFCWRARLAGFRVLMTPLAQARHRAATARGERGEGHHRLASIRYLSERAALGSMLKDYGILTLLWLLPIYAALGIGRLVYFLVTRRFDDAIDLLAAWGWNVVHLPGTLRRRLRAQSVRSARDRSVRRFMASTFRLPRFLERAEELLEEQLEEATEEAPRLRDQAASIAAAHPVIVASVLGVILAALAYRRFVGPEMLQGGALAAFPARSADFFRELLASTRSTILGGTQAASPALAGLGALSWVSFGSPALAQKILLCALPSVAGITMYRALARQTGRPAPSMVGAAAYALSGVVLWAFSEGRVSVLVALAVLPVLWDRLDQAFSREGPVVRIPRFIVGTGVAVAIGVAFAPGVALGAVLLVAAQPFGVRRMLRGVALGAASAIAAAALVFPVVPDLVSNPGAAMSSFVGPSNVWRILRLAPGQAPGAWILAAFLPVAALLCFSVVGRELRGRAWRALLVALAGIALAWASANRYLPEGLTDAPIYLVTAAVAEAALVGFGVASLAAGVARERFGYRQVAAGLLIGVMALGLGGQALQVALGDWEVGPNGLPPAWPVVASSGPGPFRILWIGRPDGARFPAPGGDPQGMLEAGDASVRYALTDRAGATVLDVGRAETGPGYAYLRRSMQELLSGETSNAGALLGPLGIRFVVAREGDVPAAALERLDGQVDMDRVQAGGLRIYRNARAMPVASVVPDGSSFANVANSTALDTIAAAPAPKVEKLLGEADGWMGTSGGGYAFVADQYASGWRARVGSGGSVAPVRAFGWALGFPDVASGSIRVTFGGGAVRRIELGVLGVLWLAALWITRKPGSA